MKRLRWWLFNLAAGVSLVLCLATGVLWARSYPGEKWERVGPHTVALVTLRGKLLFERHAYTVTPFTGTPPSTMRAANEVDDPSMRLSGWQYMGWNGDQWTPRNLMQSEFGLASAISSGRSMVGNSQIQHILRMRMLFVPLWFPLVVFMILPGIWMYRWMTRSQRAMPGFCRTCGYDLRATPERCPECGMEVRRSVASSQ